jgi:hypothetical protein
MQTERNAQDFGEAKIAVPCAPYQAATPVGFAALASAKPARLQ